MFSSKKYEKLLKIFALLKVMFWYKMHRSVKTLPSRRPNLGETQPNWAFSAFAKKNPFFISMLPLIGHSRLFKQWWRRRCVWQHWAWSSQIPISKISNQCWDNHDSCWNQQCANSSQITEHEVQIVATFSERPEALYQGQQEASSSSNEQTKCM